MTFEDEMKYMQEFRRQVLIKGFRSSLGEETETRSFFRIVRRTCSVDTHDGSKDDRHNRRE